MLTYNLSERVTGVSEGCTTYVKVNIQHNVKCFRSDICAPKCGFQNENISVFLQRTCFCCSYSSLLKIKAFSKSASYSSVVI